MRILYASERPPYPFFLGGAARCAHKLLHIMASELGVVCAAVGSNDYNLSSWAFPQREDYEALGVRDVSATHGAMSPHMRELSSDGKKGGGTVDCGYPVHLIPDFAVSLSAFIDEFKPDVVWAQLEGAREVLALAHAKGVQGLCYVHDAEFDPAELRAIGNLGCHIVCGSGFLADKVRPVIGRLAHVVYPASDWYFGTRPDPQGYVTMINPNRVKGIDTFLEIAKRLPDERFLLVESWKLSDKGLAALKGKLAHLPNVRFSPRVSDMRAIYTQTKLLLVPSVWEEGFGMVAVEAQSCHIPVIASARGGLPESVGDGGLLISDYLNVDVWLEAVGQVLKNNEQYQAFADKALNHVTGEKLSPAGAARRFLEICSSEPPPTLHIADRTKDELTARAQTSLVGKLFSRFSQLFSGKGLTK